MGNKDGVTVGVLCYNHEPYVAQCLDSILSQKCDFPFRVYVYDDVSTDRSWEIIKSYKEKYGNQMIIEQPEINSFQSGVINAFMRGLQRVNQSKYLAFCESDDYWTDDYKLQKQYDAMEKQQSAVMCVHDVKLEDVLDNNASRGIVPGRMDSGWSRRELITRILTSQLALRINGCFFLSAVLDNVDLGGLYWDCWAPDLAIFIYYLLKGDCIYIHQNMATKRVNNKGSYSYKFNIEKDICAQQARIYESDLRWIKMFDKLSLGKYTDLVQHYIAYRNIKLYYLGNENLQYNKWVSNANGKMYRQEICRKINRAYIRLVRILCRDEECRFVNVSRKWMEKEWNRIQKK